MVSTGEPSQLGKWGQYDFRKIIASISLDFWKHEKLFLLAHLFYVRRTQSCCSVSQLCPTVQPHGLQHTRLPWPSLSPGVCANSCHWDDDVIQPSRPLSPLLLLPSVFLSIRVFSNESALRIRWPKYWSFSFSISPSNEYSGLGCHFLLQCMTVKSESEVAQSCPTLSSPMDCSLPGSSVHGIFQERVLE